MCFTLELFDTPEIPEVLGECQRVLRPGGRIVVVGMSSEGPKDPLVNVLEWTHKHFPKYLDCRPIYVRRALEGAGFTIRKAATKHMWIPVEIVLGVKMLTARALGGAKVNLLATRRPIHLSLPPPNLHDALLPDGDGATKKALSRAAPLHLKRRT